ncbi:MAG TPA: FecR family protein [Kofleriaceae bacterium]|nr:FecR family protein [Kofleriaceae bacterium]
MTEHERLGPPPVEPLSDVAWSRVERGLWSRLDAAPTVLMQRPRRWRWIRITAPALAAAAAAAVLTVGLRGGAPGGEAAPTRVVSGAAPTSVTVGDVHVTLDANTAVVMDPAASALLERGGAWFAVAPRGKRPPFVVAAGDLVVRVIGTRFRVARSGEEAAVEVDHGLVEVQFRDAKTRVGTGQRWTSRRPTEVTPPRVAEAVPAAPDAAPEPEIVIEPAPLPAAPPSVSPPAPAAPTPPVPPEPRLPADRKPAPKVDRDEAAFHRLEALERRAPATAIDGYLELSRRSSRWAEPALYAAARLAADREQPRARTLLEIYLQRFPSGANADDAHKLLGHLQGAY